jgi:hypothetical protein
MQPAIETEPIVDTRGDDWTWPLELLGDDDGAVDLTGCAFDGAAITWRGGSIDLTAAGRLTVDAAGGVITIAVARADTLQVPDGQRARAVIPIVDPLAQRSTLLIVPIQVIAP